MKRYGDFLYVVEYNKYVLKRRDYAKTMYFKHWGGIGDMCFFLTYIHPYIKTITGYHKIAVVDTTEEFANQMIGLFQRNGDFDELWLIKEPLGGEQYIPEEMLYPDGNNTVCMMPGIYSVSMPRSNIPVVGYPIAMIQEELKHTKYLIPISEHINERVPVGKPLVIVQAQSRSKFIDLQRLSTECLDIIEELSDKANFVIIDEKHTDRPGRKIQSLSGIEAVDVIDIVAHCDLYFGMQSFMAMAALIFNKPMVTWRYNVGLEWFERELSSDRAKWWEWMQHECHEKDKIKSLLLSGLESLQ